MAWLAALPGFSTYCLAERPVSPLERWMPTVNRSHGLAPPAVHGRWPGGVLHGVGLPCLSHCCGDPVGNIDLAAPMRKAPGGKPSFIARNNREPDLDPKEGRAHAKCMAPACGYERCVPTAGAGRRATRRGSHGEPLRAHRCSGDLDAFWSGTVTATIPPARIL